MPPQAILDWLSANYPKPRVDPEWLDACYDWVITERDLDPNSDLQQIIREVEVQLLESDLRDSMLHGTGIPINVANDNTPCSVLSGPPILVQVESITDIGVSAYDLNKVRETREERLAAGEQEEGEGDVEVEGEGPIPRYPRSMLRLEISDGVTTIKAMEYRSIPELSLEETQLGCKLLIHNVEVRRGIVFLEPRHVTVKGHLINEREVTRGAEFARSLRQRMGLPEPDPPEEENAPPVPPPAPVQQQASVRSPLRAISPPPSSTLVDAHNHSDDEDQPRRRRVPNQSSGTPSSTSTFFENAPSGSGTGELKKSLPLSPTRKGPIIIDSDDEDENALWQANARGRLVRPLPKGRTSSASFTAPPAASASSNKGKSKEPEFLDVDDDDDSMFEDPAFLADLDAVEMAASLKAMSVPSAGPASVVSSSTTLHAKSSSAARSASVAIDTEIITIEDDEDEDDKENARPSNRHVRRRTMSRPTNPEDVIDISD